ncbi:MAG TPA: ferritin family protein [Thermoanaerobaculia bacterium]|nr:ferritin family protein [Thermoanaerobaculia bacterium]
MTITTALPDAATQLGLLFQYTVEAYKTFQKLSEMLPNPLTANMFANFAEDERNHRDLLEIKYAQSEGRIQVTLGADLRFQDMLEGDMSYREITEFLIAREKTMEQKLMETARSASSRDRNLFLYIVAGKKAHRMYLERELDFIKLYPDWFRREDAESLVVLGEPGQ